MRKRTRKGFTLLEVLVSIFLLSMGFLVTMSTLLLSQRFSRQGYARSAAYSIARQQLESLMTRTGNNLTNVNNQAFPIPAGAAAQFPGGANGIDIQGSYTIANANPAGTLKKIEVHVRWRNAASTNVATAAYSDVALASIVSGT